MMLVPRISGRRRLLTRMAVIAAIPLLVLLNTGCRLIRSAVDIPAETVRAVTPGKKEKEAADPVEVQQKLLRFSAEFSAQMIAGIDQLRRGTNPIDPAEMLRLKIAAVTESCSIASGPNAFANLLDMTVFVTSSRIAIEDYWRPKLYGASAQPILELCRSQETNIWSLAGTVLKPAQQEELREAIAAWRQQHPIPERVMGARALGFATEAARAQKTETAMSDSVFGLLGLDPLAGLDPATREIAQTRIFAERALYVTQWMPTLMRWQVELLSANAVAMPPVQQLITNSTELAASAERISRVAGQLPEAVSREREEILKALESQEKGLAALAGEFRQTMATGAQMSASLNTTLTTFDALMKRFGVGEPKPDKPRSTNSNPFRILDYAQTANQLESMARQLNELLRTLDQTVSATNLSKLAAQMSPVVQQAQSGGKEVVDHAFGRAILLIVVAGAVVLVAALIYRLLSARLTPRRDPGSTRIGEGR